MRIPMLVLTLFLAGAAAAEEAWHKVEPAGQGFAVEFPLKPSASEEKVDLGAGKQAVMRTWQIRAATAIYDVTTADYPKGMIAEIGEAQVLDNAVAGAVGNALGPLISDTKLDYVGRPARELIVDMTMGMNVRSLVFIVGDRLFNVGAITKKGNERSPEIERYFTSFKLAK